MLLTACSADATDHLDLDSIAFDTVRIVGAIEGPEHEVFGRLAALVSVGERGFFVLDRQSSRVEWFDTAARHVDGINARGQGPGELAGPVDMAVTDHELHVLDNRALRINRYALTDSGVVYVDAVRNAMYGSRICGLGGRLFIQAVHDDSLVHELGAGGEVIRSFARRPVFGYPTAVAEAARQDADRQLAMGLLLCAPDADLVVQVPLGSAPIRAFTTDGQLRWEVMPAEHRSLELAVEDGGAWRYLAPSELGAHVPASVSQWSPTLLLVQYEIRRTDVARPADSDFHNLESRFLDAETGQEVARRTDLPLIAAVHGEHVYALRNRPVPQVIVMRRR